MNGKGKAEGIWHMEQRKGNRNKSKEFTYQLKNPSLVVSQLRLVDFDQEEILNFDLLEHLLQPPACKSLLKIFLCSSQPKSPLTKYVNDNIGMHIGIILENSDGEIADLESAALAIPNNSTITTALTGTYGVVGAALFKTLLVPGSFGACAYR